MVVLVCRVLSRAHDYHLFASFVIVVVVVVVVVVVGAR